MTDGTTDGLNKAAVFICHCSGNISEHVDINIVKKTLKAEGFSVYDYEYLCSSQGQALIKKKISEGHVDRVVIVHVLLPNTALFSKSAYRKPD